MGAEGQSLAGCRNSLRTHPRLPSPPLARVLVAANPSGVRTATLGGTLTIEPRGDCRLATLGGSLTIRPRADCCLATLGGSLTIRPRADCCLATLGGIQPVVRSSEFAGAVWAAGGGD
jgi:hypothetical protein